MKKYSCLTCFNRERHEAILELLRFPGDVAYIIREGKINAVEIKKISFSLSEGGKLECCYLAEMNGPHISKEVLTEEELYCSKEEAIVALYEATHEGKD